jgi:hypothetical protein
VAPVDRMPELNRAVPGRLQVKRMMMWSMPTLKK